MDILDRNTILDMIGAGRGPQDGVWIPLAFVEWMGSYESAAMLNQFFFYRDLARREGRTEFYMSYDQWRAKLFLTERQVRGGLERLRAVGVRTRAARDPHGNRVLFYSLDPDAFLSAYQAFLSGRGVQNVPAEVDDTSEPPLYDLYGRIYTEESTEETNRESVPPAPDLRISDVSPQTTNGHISNGRLMGYATKAPQSKGARPVAADEPPPVVVKVPPGTPVNRQPDAPAVRPVPKPEPSSKLLSKWEPPSDFAEWYAEACTARKRQPTSIDLIAELQKFRVHPSTRKLAPGEWGAHWQLWILRAFDGMGQPRGAPAPPAPTVTGQHYRVVSTKGD